MVPYFKLNMLKLMGSKDLIKTNGLKQKLDTKMAKNGSRINLKRAKIDVQLQHLINL